MSTALLGAVACWGVLASFSFFFLFFISSWLFKGASVFKIMLVPNSHVGFRMVSSCPLCTLMVLLFLIKHLYQQGKKKELHIQETWRMCDTNNEVHDGGHLTVHYSGLCEPILSALLFGEEHLHYKPPITKIVSWVCQIFFLISKLILPSYCLCIRILVPSYRLFFKYVLK